MGHKRLDRGTTSLAVLVAMLPLVLIGGTLLRMVVSGHREGRQVGDKEAVQAAAVAGAHEALNRLSLDRDWAGGHEFELNGGEVAITVRHWESDGMDNDDNGAIDDAFENDLIEIESRAWLYAAEDEDGNPEVNAGTTLTGSTLLVTKATNLDFAFDQAIYIDSPTATLDINGGAFILSGHDKEIDDSDGSEDSRPAIGVNGDPQHLIDQVAGNQTANITGSLADPAIGTVDGLIFSDYRDRIAPLATRVWEELENSFSGTLGSFDPPVPVIAYSKGDLRLHGGCKGIGVLLVDGDLEVSGRFLYAGVLIVRGNVEVNGGGQRQELYGSLALWGESPDPADLRISGTVQMAFSQQAVDIASRATALETLFWQER